MHLEALLFTKINLKMLISYPNIIYNNKEKLITEIEFIKYEGNTFNQGTNE